MDRLIHTCFMKTATPNPTCEVWPLKPSGHFQPYSPSRTGPGPRHHHNRSSYRESQWCGPRANRKGSEARPYTRPPLSRAPPPSLPRPDLLHCEPQTLPEPREFAFPPPPEQPPSSTIRRERRLQVSACVLAARLRLRGNVLSPAIFTVAISCPASVHVLHFRTSIGAKHPGFSLLRSGWSYLAQSLL